MTQPGSRAWSGECRGRGVSEKRGRGSTRQVSAGRRGWGSGPLGLREEGAGGLDPESEGGGGLNPTALVREDENFICKSLGLSLGLLPAAPPSSQPHLRTWKGPTCLGAQPEGAKTKRCLTRQGGGAGEEVVSDGKVTRRPGKGGAQPGGGGRRPASLRPVASNPPTAVFWIYTSGGFRDLGSCHLVVFGGNCRLSISPVSVQFSRRVVQTPWTAARQASLSISSSQSLPKLIPV